MTETIYALVLFAAVFMTIRQLVIIVKYHAVIGKVNTLTVNLSFWAHMAVTAALITAAVVLG